MSEASRSEECKEAHHSCALSLEVLTEPDDPALQNDGEGSCSSVCPPNSQCFLTTPEQSMFLHIRVNHESDHYI